MFSVTVIEDIDEDDEQVYYAFVKGSPEVIMPHVTEYYTSKLKVESADPDTL